MAVSSVHYGFYTQSIIIKIYRAISGICKNCCSGFSVRKEKYQIINQLYEVLEILRLGW